MNNNKNEPNSSFDELYIRYHRMVFSICMSVTHDTEQARDISQEVFIRLYQWWDRIDDMGKIKGWLCITAKNMSINAVRKEQRICELKEEETASENNPEEIYLTKERKTIIENALSQLDEKYNEVLSMKYMLGFSVKEIAKATNTLNATVYTRLRRAEKALNELLKEALI
ncbi:MAG: sigma-70 family RNA polymerase sigma factor [bacterium]|nr:sigma-70 family RNA polymerase sigma factor [bacterium]